MVFLYLISRFYEAKFHQPTYYNAYVIPAVAFVLMLVAVLLGACPCQTALVVNMLILLVLLIFGIRLYRQMTGVHK